MDAAYGTRPTLRTTFEGAKSFGLSDTEAWKLFDRCLDEVGDDATVSEYMDELAAMLARGILAKERRTLSGTADPNVEPRLRRRPAA